MGPNRAATPWLRAWHTGGAQCNVLCDLICDVMCGLICGVMCGVMCVVMRGVMCGVMWLTGGARCNLVSYY